MNNATFISTYTRKSLFVFLTFLIFLFWNGCVENKVQPAFDLPPAQRQQQATHDLRATLKSSPYGWKMSYQPNEKAGTYRFLFKFLKDSIVETWSDVSASSEVKKSKYQIIWGSTTKLSFTTNSQLHRLSDTDISPFSDKSVGLAGSFEFLYYGVDANSKGLLFRTDRDQKRVVFEKATARYLDTLKAYTQNLKRFISSMKGGNFEPSINYTKGGKTIKSRLKLSVDNRTLTIRNIITRNEEAKVSKFFGGYVTRVRVRRLFDTPYINTLIFDSNSIRIGKLQVGQEELKNLHMTYHTKEKKYKASLANGAEIEITTNKDPLIDYAGHRELLNQQDRYTVKVIVLHKDAGISHLVSPTAKFVVDAFYKSGLTHLALIFKNRGGLNALIGATTLPDRKGEPLAFIDTFDSFSMMVDEKSPQHGPVIFTGPKASEKTVAYMRLMTALKRAPLYAENIGPASSKKYSNDVFILTSSQEPSFKIPFMKEFTR